MRRLLTREQWHEILFVIIFTLVALVVFSFLSGCLSASKQQAAYTQSEIAVEGLGQLRQWFIKLSDRTDRLEERPTHSHGKTDKNAEETIPWYVWLFGGGGVTAAATEGVRRIVPKRGG